MPAGAARPAASRSCKSIDDVRKEAERLLGSTLVTHQTGPQGKQVNRLYIEEGSTIDREFYLSALVDRETSRVAFVVSTEGGMDIEEVAHNTPEKIMTFSVDPATGIMPHHGRRVAQALALTRRSRQAGREPCDQALRGLRRQGHEPARDQSAGRHQGRTSSICLDAKIGFDDNALYRHPDIVGAARSHRRGREGDRGVEIRSQLRGARRHHRLHGQRRRARHGDHGHHQALRRGAGELPRCRRRRHARRRSRPRSRSSPPTRR